MRSPVLELQRRWDGLWLPPPSTCVDLDGVYMAIRASMQHGKYRWPEVREACRRYLREAARFLNDPHTILETIYGRNTHYLHGPLFAVAECAEAFPELQVHTLRKWRRKQTACIYA